MASNVVRIVNLPENARDHRWLKNYIELRVQLIGKIKQIYVRRHFKLNLMYAYVIFESNIDAEETMRALDGVVNEDKKWDVSLIGPLERYTKYNVGLRKTNEDEPVTGAEGEQKNVLTRLQAMRARVQRAPLTDHWKRIRQERQRQKIEHDLFKWF